jgi:hypothetical protein
MSIVKKTIEDLKKGPSLLWLYYGTIILFWIVYFYLSFKHGAPFIAMQIIVGKLAPLWSPTKDPVLNFLIDAIIVVVALALSVGIVISGFFLIIAIAVIRIVASLLILLASVSVTGAIISASIVIGSIILIVRTLLKSSQGAGTNTTSTDYSGSYYSDSTSDFNSTSEPEVSPIFKATKIDKAILSDDKILRDSSGRKIGRLEKAILSNDQIIRDSSGRKVGRIEHSIWDKDKQIIKGTDGEKEGEIKTDFWGNRVIVDSKGEKIGKIEKNIWGETVIKKK